MLLAFLSFQDLLSGRKRERKQPPSGDNGGGDGDKGEGEIVRKKPHLSGEREFRPFDYAGSKFTEFTKGKLASSSGHTHQRLTQVN